MHEKNKHETGTDKTKGHTIAMLLARAVVPPAGLHFSRTLNYLAVSGNLPRSRLLAYVMNPAEQSEQDLRHYLIFLKKRWPVIVAVTLAVGVSVFVVTMRRPKIYQATATVIIDPQAPKALGADSVEVVRLGTGDSWGDTEYYNTQSRILTSYSLARAVVTRYHLEADPRLVGERADRNDDQLLDDAAELLRSKVIITPAKETRVFGISVRDRNAELATELANDVVDVYIDQNLSVKREATSNAKGWVSRLLDAARHDLDNSETALYSFKKDKNILSVSLEDQKNKVTKALDTFSSALTEAKRKRIDLEAKRRALAAILKDDLIRAPSSFIVESAIIDRQREVYFEESRKLSGLEERYGPKHQDVVMQVARVNAARASLEQTAASVLKALDGEIAALHDVESRYNGEVTSLTAEAFALNKQEIEYKRLSRDANNAEQVYSQLLKRLNESGLQEQDHANNIRTLDAARLPETPVEPNLRTAAPLGLLLGLSLALALAFLLEYLDRTVRSQEDLEKLLGVPFLGIIPSVENPTPAQQARIEMHAFDHPKSNVAECCRVVRTNVLFCSPEKPLRALVVTSASAAEGKTLNVVQLGILMAQSGQRTLLVDTDMRRPRLHKALRVSNERGMSGLVVGEGTIEGAVKSTEVPNLFILPCGPIPPNPSELLQTERFAALVKALTDRYDRVIFDSPPVLGVTDAVILSRVADGTVLVVRSARTTRDTLARGFHGLRSVNANVVGTVLNDVNLKNANYAHYYNYYSQTYDTPAAAVSGETRG
jgi:capsular exopolysaccharide synthesis family protein